MTAGSFVLFGVLTTWLTPLWLLSVGISAGLLSMAAVWGLLWLVAQPRALLIWDSVREGILLPILCLAAGMLVLAIVGAGAVPYRALLASVSRIHKVGTHTVSIDVPAATKGFEVPIEKLGFRTRELMKIEIESDQPVTVHTKVSKGAGPQGAIAAAPGQAGNWSRPVLSQKPMDDEVSEWDIDNLGPKGAKVNVTLGTDIEFPEVRVVPAAALSLVGLVAVLLLLRFALPKVAAIGLTTAKEAMGQPLFPVLLAVGVVALVAFIYIPYNTFGEDVKMLKDSGLTLIMVLSIIVAVWSASVSVADEIEGRTALTVLSKPIRRWQFIIGKFVGVVMPVVLMFVMLGALFLMVVSYKVVYDARELGQQEPTWQNCYYELIGVVPGLVLALMETVVLASISVAISTRLPMLANLVICTSIYVLGNLVPMLVNSSAGQIEIVRFFGQFLATVLPVLDHFNIQPAVAAGALVPGVYLAWALLYCLLYSTIAMFVALALFEDRDLA